jgi:hypothetical protein
VPLDCAVSLFLWRAVAGGCCGHVAGALRDRPLRRWHNGLCLVLLKAGAGGCDWLCVWTMLLCGLCALCCSYGLDCVASVLLCGCFYGLDYVVILCVGLCLLL